MTLEAGVPHVRIDRSELLLVEQLVHVLERGLESVIRRDPQFSCVLAPSARYECVVAAPTVTSWPASAVIVSSPIRT
jgi:hypothetical protein